jgi:hypothetical protein
MTMTKCPHCKREYDNPLESLKSHLKSHAEQQRVAVAQIESETKSDPGSRRNRYLESRRKAMLKWQSWVDAIEQLEGGAGSNSE